MAGLALAQAVQRARDGEAGGGQETGCETGGSGCAHVVLTDIDQDAVRRVTRNAGVNNLACVRWELSHKQQVDRWVKLFGSSFESANEMFGSSTICRRLVLAVGVDTCCLV